MIIKYPQLYVRTEYDMYRNQRFNGWASVDQWQSTHPWKLGNAGSNSAGCDNFNTYLLINIQATFYPGRKRKTWLATWTETDR